ncbi:MULTISPECIES: hypothetical protein [Glaesserella]|nr:MULTISPECIES: hypothetical protein [Glaesserella]AUI66715.1 hypothetical protein CJD39_09060 [Glaesserella sp. 15-184]
MIIWNISDYFYHKKRDLYFIRFHNTNIENDYEQLPEREMLLTWFKDHLPNVEVRPIALFYMDSGILSGFYDGSISIDFDEESLKKFCDHWEDGNNKSLDDRFQCHWITLEFYKQQNNGKIPNPNEYYDSCWADE